MQTNIFEIPATGTLTVEQAAKMANVSVATIRNWIKTGYLTQSGRGLVSQESVEHFMAHVAGKDKLNARANKQHKDEHNHKEVSDSINLLIQKFEGESIGIEYENSLSNSYRNKEGIYYTPSWVVKDMLKGINFSRDFKFLDPCCGSGNFILEAIRSGVAPENVYGFDTDENAVFITKQRIKEEFGFETSNIQVGNFLQEAYKLSNAQISFDLIFTNPPWGKKIEKADKESYATIYGCGNSLDTTSLFMGASLAILKNGGVLGFLIQEAFFNITTFEDIRKKAATKKILRFADFGKPFKGLLTKAQAIIIKNTAPEPGSTIECNVNKLSFNRSIDSFKRNSKTIFNFWATEEEALVIDRLYAVKHITLKGKAKWALGIVTGNNNKFCSNTLQPGYIPIFKGSDITKAGLKEPNTFISADFSNFQQVAPLDMYLAKEKLIYKFISSDLCFFYDTQQKYILNSANLLIPLNTGITGEQLTMLLNSEIVNWLFKKLYATHKILRGDLEMLPIHIDYFRHNEVFTEENFLNYLQITKTPDGTFRIKG